MLYSSFFSPDLIMSNHCFFRFKFSVGISVYLLLMSFAWPVTWFIHRPKAAILFKNISHVVISIVG